MQTCLVIALLGCGTRSSPPAPAPPKSCPSCTCEAMPPGAGWHASLDDTRRALAALSPSILESCKQEFGGAMTSDELATTIDFCLDKTRAGELRISYCKGPEEADACCTMRVTSKEVEGRKLITIRHLDIADYTAAVFELGAKGPALRCEWAPYMTPACASKDPAVLPATGCPELDAEWKTASQALRDYYCSAGG